MTYLFNNKNIPEDLLFLFSCHQDEILDKHLISSDDLIQEPSEDYILESIKGKKLTEKTFSESLLYYIDLSSLSDVQVYKRAFIDKRMFSKIRSNKSYHPSFGTVVALSLALKLSTFDFKELLHSAGYSLPQNSYINITLQYCFDNEIYDILRVNELIYTISNKEIRDLWCFLNISFITSFIRSYLLCSFYLPQKFFSPIS